MNHHAILAAEPSLLVPCDRLSHPGSLGRFGPIHCELHPSVSSRPLKTQQIPASPAPPGASRLYGRLWRWHFFAALLVIPFVLWQATTGVLYLWHEELTSLVFPSLTRVAPQGPIRSLDEQLAAVKSHHTGDPLEAIEVYADPARATGFFFRDANGLPYPAFVNPHTSQYLGSVPSTHWLRGLTRGLHGGWPIQPYGSYLLELGASWAIVMILTGVYLWWPRNAQGLGGVLYPRLRAGSRIFWRDLHATVAIYFALIVLAFLMTALPWTTFWGNQVLGRIEQGIGQTSPVAFFFSGGADHHHATTGTSAGHEAHGRDSLAPQALSLDQIVKNARAAGVRGDLEIHPGAAGAPVNVRDDHPRNSDVVWLQLDGQSGAVRTRVTWSDFPLLPKLVALGVDLHQGTYFGRANQIFNTLVATSLVWLSVTGFIGWYRRRPSTGGLAAPPRREVQWPKPLRIGAVIACIALPMLGVSVLALWIADLAFGRFMSART